MECRILCIFENRSHSILKLMHWIAVVQIVPTSIEVDDSACSDDLVTGQGRGNDVLFARRNC